MSQLNVDPQEIAKFEALAALWWDQHSEFRPLHQINPLRLNWIDEHANGLTGKKILDVGCGGGILAESMARRGADVLGIDMGAAPLNVARLHAEQENVHNIEYRQIPVEQLAEEQAGQYDIVTCMEMLEHVPDPASVVAACAELVKPGGWVFFSTINRSAKAFGLAIVAAEYLLKMIPKGTHEYAKLIQPSELAMFARQAGLDLQASKGLQHNPVTGRYWLSADTSVNYMLATRRAGE
jgi:2-polyprenyl-6-hydroxyphenyl methylase/3-demethylubiquinone-9 3-methyltransferase